MDGVSGFLSKVRTLRASAWSSSQAVRRLRIWLPGLTALCALVLVYAGTLHGDIHGRSNNNYMDDSGEIQVALNIWGTIHYTGYPLYTILGALLVQVARAIGLSPAAAASATSAVWSLLALAILYLVLLRLTGGERVLAALTVLAIGLVETFWIHSVIDEFSNSRLGSINLEMFPTRLGWNPEHVFCNVLVTILQKIVWILTVVVTAFVSNSSPEPISALLKGI